MSLRKAPIKIYGLWSQLPSPKAKASFCSTESVPFKPGRRPMPSHTFVRDIFRTLCWLVVRSSTSDFTSWSHLTTLWTYIWTGRDLQGLLIIDTTKLKSTVLRSIWRMWQSKKWQMNTIQSWEESGWLTSFASICSQSIKFLKVGRYGSKAVEECFYNIQSLIIKTLKSVQKLMPNDKHCF